MLAPDLKDRPPCRLATLRLRRAAAGELGIGGGEPCAVMAIVNLTPDSFSDGGQLVDAESARRRIDALIAAGAALIDLGAESTRPLAELLDAETEWARLAPVLRELSRRPPPVVLSIDTCNPETARRAAEHGVSLLNLTFPQHLLSPPPERRARGLSSTERAALFSRFDGMVLMHSRGTPKTMRELTDYGRDLCKTVATELAQTAAELVGDDPVLSGRLLFDPGLGFAKTPEQSLALLGRTAELRAALGRPLLVGASRKSLLGAATGLPIAERLIPSVAAAVLAAAEGAAMVRVHDVAETVVALKLVRAVASARAQSLPLEEAAS